MVNSFPIYIAQDKAFSFQLLDNLTQLLTITAMDNTFNVTVNSLIMQNDEGQFQFTPNEDSTIKINHNMDYVQIRDYNNTSEDILVNDNAIFYMYTNKLVTIIFKIKGYDISGVFTQIVFFVISVVGLIITPPMSDILTKNKKDKMEQVFIWVIGWLFFGMLFFVWIYSW